MILGQVNCVIMLNIFIYIGKRQNLYMYNIIKEMNDIVAILFLLYYFSKSVNEYVILKEMIKPLAISNTCFITVWKK